MKVLIVLFACSLSLVSSAQVYKWVDKHGRVHYGDQQVGDFKPHDFKEKINSYRSVTYQNSDIYHDDKVVIYTKPTCPYCIKALSFFKKNKIKYKEYDITNSNYAMRKYERLKATGVPVTFIGKNRINGFSLARFEREFADF